MPPRHGRRHARLLDGVAQASARYFAAAIPTGEFRAWVAEAGGRVLASGGLVIHAIPPTPQALAGREGYIMNLYTLPEWRRRGIARAIMQAILEHLRAEGVSLASLHATEMGRPLYVELGFRPTNELRLVLEPHPAGARNNQ